jgi:putative acetyltransferase
VRLARLGLGCENLSGPRTGWDPSSLVWHTSKITAMHLRARIDADLASIADLWVASWQEAIPAIDFLARRPWFLDRLRALEAAGAVTICALEDADRLLGFVTFDPVAAYLDQLAVAPEAKGSGAASLLLTEARRLSPAGLTLEVNQDNSRALRFYEREGFEKIAEGINPLSGLKTWRLRFSKEIFDP